MIVFQLLYRTIFNVTETFFKMASKLPQKWLTIFCQKAQNFVYFVPYNLVNISPVWPKYLPNNVWRDFLMSGSVMVTLNARSENQFLQSIRH